MPSYGATEAKVPDIVDAIVDVTETGSSLRKHGLKVIETLLVSRTELVANAEAHADQEKRAAMEEIALLLTGVIRARGRVLLKANVADPNLAAVLAELPSMTSPNVTPLADGRAARRRVGRAQEGRQHPHSEAEGGRRLRHPRAAHQQDRRVRPPAGAVGIATGLSVVAGVLLAGQAHVNGELDEKMGAAVPAALVSFVVGTAAIWVVVACHAGA